MSRILQTALLAFGLITLAPMATSGVTDVLDRPALATERATSAVMLAISNAGPRVVAVGERGVIVLSDDKGVSWRTAKVPVSTTLTSVHFPSAQQGWAVGHSGVVLHSADGGASWSRQLDGRQAARLALEEAKARTGESQARMLSDAERLVADGPDKPFLAVHFFDERRGFVVGAYGLAFATEDGGENWFSIQSRIDNPSGKHLYAIHATDSAILIVGEQGAFFRSDTASLSFASLSTPYDGTIFGVLTPAADQLLIFGLRGNAFWSGDAGRTWTRTDVGARNSLMAGLRLDDGRVVLLDEAGRALSSQDGGRTFRPWPVAGLSHLTGATQSGDGFLLLSGLRGISRIAVQEE